MCYVPIVLWKVLDTIDILYISHITRVPCNVAFPNFLEMDKYIRNVIINTEQISNHIHARVNILVARDSREEWKIDEAWSLEERAVSNSSFYGTMFDLSILHGLANDR